MTFTNVSTKNWLRSLATGMGIFPLLAHAHVGQGDFGGGLGAGFMHPILGADHVAAMLAVGMWGAQLGRPALWVLPVTFPLVMSVGAAMGIAGIPLPGVESGIAASAIALGLMIAFAVRPPLAIAMLLVGVFAIFHGYAHGVELPVSTNAVDYALGFIVATGLLHAIGISIGEVRRLRDGMSLLRGLGAVVALAGAYFLWIHLKGT